MITISPKADLFADFDNGVTNAIVIPVNCVGVMGAGVALRFKQRYPAASDSFNKRKVDAGNVYRFGGNWGAVMATTKQHWRDPSKLIWVEGILKQLIGLPETYGIIGLPALGCGLGGLNWEDVKALYEKYLTDSPINFVCYEPK